MTSQKAIALRISNLLIRDHLNPYTLCKRIAMPEATLRSILNERYQTVKFDTLVLISDGFGMTIQEFLNDDLFKRENLDIL